MLTKRQKQILDYIKKHIKENDYPPSLEEIGRYFKLSSLATVHQHIEALKSKGYLKDEPRTIQIEENKKSLDLVEIPLLGLIAAGQPIETYENKETITVPKSSIGSGEHYALKVQGDSMIDEGILDGSTVIVKKQSTAQNGDTVVALINGSEVTLKKFYLERNKILLQPANPKIKPILVEPDNLLIQGKVINIWKDFAFKNIKAKTKEIKKNKIKNGSKTILKKWLNTIQCMDCVEGMKKLPNDSIDLVITSPPYDNIRNYNGFTYNLHNTGKEIYRILKDGGIAVMVIQDQTKNFGKTLTSFKTIIDWCDNIGFKLFETTIYRKYGTEGAWWKNRFRVDHEYMPIFLKGERPQYFNKEPLKIPSKHGGKVMTGSGNRKTNGETTKTVTRSINKMKCRGTIWNYLMAGDKNPIKRKHPAVFPDKIPFDFIQCFCPANGIVLDPFMGSGSTAVVAKQLKRNYIGFDISKEYCELAEKRIKQIQNYLF